MQIERPQKVTDEINTLLTNGTVEELKSEKGEFLRLFFTADEVDRAKNLPMKSSENPPDSDGLTCALCRGDMRFGSCGKCKGSFDNLAPINVVAREEARKEAIKKDTGAVKMFFDRLMGRDASY